MSTSVIRCHTISPGIAVGSLCCCEPFFNCLTGPAELFERQMESEIDRFKKEVAALVKDLAEIANRLESESLSAEAAVIRAHIAILQDPMFHGQVQQAIERPRLSAERAVDCVMQDVIRMLSDAEDPGLAERAADLEDLAIQLRARLCCQQGDPLLELLSTVRDPVLVVPTLYPSVVLNARRHGVKAFLVGTGTALSHGAILAKAFALPALRIPNFDLVRASQGARVLVDADKGELFIEPHDREISGKVGATQATIDDTQDRADHPLPIGLWVNIVTPAQLESLDWRQIEGVGLYRSETLFMDGKDDFPSEEEQVNVYQYLFSLCGNRPVTVRTADLGGDKPLSYMSFGPQENPYLGLRGHRIYHYHPELLVTQLRAILRAAAGPHALRLLYPMLETIEEWHFIQSLLEQAMVSLDKEKVPFQQEFEQGVLIETPAAVLSFPRFLEVIDFASIGTNDLIQYLFAVERNNANVGDLYQPEHPVVLQVLKSLTDQAREAGKALSLCGEIVGNPEMLPLLVGLGFEHVSVATGTVRLLRARLSSLDISVCHDLAHRCAEARTAAQVRALLGIRGQESTGDVPPQLLPGQAVDPVCRMVVHTEGNSYSLVRDGRRYFFCCRSCALRFQKGYQREQPTMTALTGPSLAQHGCSGTVPQKSPQHRSRPLKGGIVITVETA